MTAPNIVGVTTITGKIARGALTTSAAAIVNNAVSSNNVIKVGTLTVTNIDGTSAASVTVNHYDQDDIGGTAMAIASTITVPADASIVIISKNNPLYLEEDMSIGGLASADGDLVFFCSYEEIS